MKHWFITGISRGLGLAMAKAAIANGDRVWGTTRGAAQDIAHVPGQLNAVTLDLGDPQQVVPTVQRVFGQMGRVDVIVNNAGYGLLGAVEDAADADLYQLFEVDVFAPIRIVRAALPCLRQQGHGHVVNITSIAGRAPGVGSALYATAKFALEGFSASLAQEVGAFGVHVTAVAPGQFRTGFLSDTSLRRSTGASDARSPALDAALAQLSRLDQHQPGDPDRAAQAILQAVYSDAPPRQLLLGSDALDRATRQQQAMTEEMRAWEALTRSTDFPVEPAAR